MTISRTYLILVFLIGFSSKGWNQISLAKEMAKTIMTQYQDSLVVSTYLNHLMKEKSSSTKKEKAKPAKWNYEIGVVLMGFDRLWRVTGDKKYLDYTKTIIDHFIDAKGEIKTYSIEDFNIDNIPTGRQLITLYQTYKDKRYLIAVNTLKHQIDFQPRTREGGFWHKHRYPYQMWLDGLYMGEPFRAEYALLTNDDKEWDDIAYQFIWMANGSRDTATGLMYHAFDESRIQRWSDPQTGKSPEFWSRAMGWYMMGLVDVLDLFPDDHPKKKELITIFLDLSRALIKVQDLQAKVWWQVTDKAHQTGNYLESSCTAMFVASLLKGVRLGYLPDDFLEPALQGYEGMLKEFVTTDTLGMTHFNQAVAGAGLGGTPYRDGSYDYYVKEPKRDDDLKAIGPLMQAAIEYELAKKYRFGVGKVVMLDRFYNNEYKNGQRYHYTWEDKMDSGFSWFGSIFKDYGAKLESLDDRPTEKNLAEADVYIIVDPDHIKDNPTPNPINAKDAACIEKWVKNGGSLLLMTNDTTNADVVNANILAKKFGISFTMKNINFVKNDHFLEGDVISTVGNPVFQQNQKFYVKELVTLEVGKNVNIAASAGQDIVMACTSYGKGKVFIIGDPWLYNEYVNGRKLPSDYKNFDAAQELAVWLIKSSK